MSEKNRERTTINSTLTDAKYNYIYKYLMMLVANKYDADICEYTDPFMLNNTVVVVKANDFEIVCSKGNLNYIAFFADEPRETTSFEYVKSILTNAISKENITDLNDKIEDALMQKIADERSDNITVSEILYKYSTNIFNYDILFDILLNVGYIDYKQKGYRFVREKGLKMYRQKNLKMYIDSLVVDD